MPTKKKSKSAPIAKKRGKTGKWEKVIATTTRALRGKRISPAKKIELLEKRAEAYKALGGLKEQASDIEKLAALQKTQIDESSQAYKQTRAELEILSSIAQALVDQADYQRIGEIVGEGIHMFFNADITGIGLYDKAAGIVSVPYYNEHGELKKVASYEYGKGVTSYVLKTRKPIYIPTAKEAKKYGVIYSKELPSETMLFAPIISGKEALGVLSIQHSQPYAYGKHELEILNAIANSMAVAVENARLFNEIQKSHREISDALAQQIATSDILRTLANAPTDINPVLEAVARHAASLCEANDVQIYKVDGDQLRQLAHFGPLPALQDGEGLPLVPGLVTGRAVLERRTIHLEDARNLSKEDYPERG